MRVQSTLSVLQKSGTSGVVCNSGRKKTKQRRNILNVSNNKFTFLNSRYVIPT